MGEGRFQKLKGQYVMCPLHQLIYKMFYQAKQIPVDLLW